MGRHHGTGPNLERCRSTRRGLEQRANWGGTTPISSATTDLTFAGSLQTAATNNLANPFLLRHLTFGGTAGSFTLAGEPLQLGGNVTNLSGALQTLALDIGLSGNSLWNSGGGGLELTGNLLGGGHTLTKTGAGLLTFSGNTSDLGGLLLSGGTVVATSGAVVTNAGLTFGTAAPGALHLSGGAWLTGVTNSTFISDGARVGLTGAGTAWNQAGGPLWLRRGATLLIDDGAAVTNGAYVSLRPPGQGTFAGSSVVVTNGGMWRTAGLTNIIGDAFFETHIAARGHTVVVAGARPGTGTPSLWNLGGAHLFVGAVRDGTTRAEDNRLIVGPGGIVTNVAILSLARSQGGVSNRVDVLDGGRLYSSGAADIGNNGDRNTMLVSGVGTLWDNGGGALRVGTSAGSSACSFNELRVVGGAVVTNLGGVSLGHRTGGGATTRANLVLVADGGRMHSAGELNVGLGHTGLSVGNLIHVTGGGSLWSAGGAHLRVGRAHQGGADGNFVRIEHGGVLTNAGPVSVGYANAVAANLSLLEVRAGGRLHSTGAAIVGRANPSTAQPRAASQNGVVVGGAGALWHLGGAALTIGNATAGPAHPLCNATSNWVRVEGGGTITGVGALTVGNGALATTNRVELAGGALNVGSFVLGAANILAPVVTAAGVTAMTVAGTATLGAGSWVAPSAESHAPGGTFTVLTAASVVNNGVALSPETDVTRWALNVTSTAVTLTRRFPATLIVVR